MGLTLQAQKKPNQKNERHESMRLEGPVFSEGVTNPDPGIFRIRRRILRFGSPRWKIYEGGSHKTYNGRVQQVVRKLVLNKRVAKQGVTKTLEHD